MTSDLLLWFLFALLFLVRKENVLFLLFLNGPKWTLKNCLYFASLAFVAVYVYLGKLLHNLSSAFFYSWTTRGSVSSWSSPAPPAKNIFASMNRSAITSESAQRERSTASTARSHFTSKTLRFDMINLDLPGCLSGPAQQLPAALCACVFVCVCVCGSLKEMFFFPGTWRDLPQVSDDLRRLCQEENTQRKGERVKKTCRHDGNIL